jgi:hypothetical protein
MRSTAETIKATCSTSMYLSLWDRAPFISSKLLTMRMSSLHICYDKGPNGSPTFDKSGFVLDYNKVANRMKPSGYNKGAIVRGMESAVDRIYRERREMAAIFFEKGEAPANPEHARGDDYWKDRVSKDLNVPWHKIGVEHFREWEKKGFKKASRGEYETFSDAERKRGLRLLSGASLRK